MTQAVRIKDLGRHEGQVVAVRGWVTHVRSKGKIAFVVVRDGSGIVQTVASLQDVGEAALARMDGADLTEALGALIENAATHARAAVSLGAVVAGGKVRVTIRDDGPGLPPDQIDRLRQRGQRLDMSGGGTGLGLSIADEIVARAGGRLDLDNAASGLTVRLTLPAA